MMAIHFLWPVGLTMTLLGSRLLWYAVKRHHRRSRVKERRCLTCGYDLRATPERCPEMFSLL
jgi:hypothetical protein